MKLVYAMVCTLGFGLGSMGCMADIDDESMDLAAEDTESQVYQSPNPNPKPAPPPTTPQVPQEGDSCGNDGDTWEVTEDDCTYTIRQTCMLKYYYPLGSGPGKLVCNCEDHTIGEDCPGTVQTPGGR